MTQPSEGPRPPGQPFPPHFFERVDHGLDSEFYREPRFVTHIDDETIESLTTLYRELIPVGADVLDLMSSWVSHLPEDVRYGRVAGLGMNRRELDGNPQLTEHTVHDLNADPQLPYPDASFDYVLNAVSVQYLTRPVEVFASVRRVLRPGGAYLVACSHRMFPTKAVAVWRALAGDDRIRLVASYFSLAGGYEEPMLIDRSPEGADPLWVVYGRRAR
ncbi:MAG: methyltransferase domain-containing protein [Dehalococcoidia bacterium]|nr:methyltransferase domain-containing protein [Dehalococcoidia bacterium]